MSLVSCVECGASVSTAAPVCPHCGVPEPGGKAGECLGCGRHIRISSGDACPSCGIPGPLTPLRARATRQGAKSGGTELDPTVGRLGAAGSILLLLGPFLPIVRVPFAGPQNYVQNGQGDGMLIVLLAVASLVVVIARRPQWLVVTGGLSALLITLTFVRLISAIDEMGRSVDRELAGNPFRGLADVALQGVGLEWGWVVLFLGAGLTVAAGAIHRKARPT